MRLLLGVGVLVVLVIVLVSAVQHSERNDSQARFQNTLASYRAALKSGATREQVESYLQQQNTSFTSGGCESSTPCDRVDLGEEPRNLFCQPWKVSAEFRFNNTQPPTGAPKTSDLLTAIELHREGVCF